MAMDHRVATYYTVSDLQGKILEAARAAGVEPDRLDVSDLAAADEFHIGGRQATVDLLDQLAPGPDMHLLDVGSGPGGASRFAADRYGCDVTGVDMTPEYVNLASDLAARMALDGRVHYQVADACELPFAPDAFDGAYMLHVGMNVGDKHGLCTEVARTVAPGGFFAVYDVMRVGDGDVGYPVPWADSDAISFLASPEEYRGCLEAAGFEITSVRSRREFALEFFSQLQARMAASGPPPLGLHLLMGESFPHKVGNMVDALGRGVIAPVEMIASLPR